MPFLLFYNILVDTSVFSDLNKLMHTYEMCVRLCVYFPVTVNSCLYFYLLNSILTLKVCFVYICFTEAGFSL